VSFTLRDTDHELCLDESTNSAKASQGKKLVGLDVFMGLLICYPTQMFTMTVNPMGTPVQVFRRGQEIAEYPLLAPILVPRDEAYCELKRMEWEEHVLVPLERRRIPVRTIRPLQYINRGHWGPWAHVNDWAVMAAAFFKNEASMISWVIESGHLPGDFLHSQCCVLAMFCSCVNRSIPLLLSRRKRQSWTRMFELLQCLVCKERRFPWGHATTREYTSIIIDRICECLDFSAFVLAADLRDLTLTQVLPMAEFVENTRRQVWNGQLQQLVEIVEIVFV